MTSPPASFHRYTPGSVGHRLQLALDAGELLLLGLAGAAGLGRDRLRPRASATAASSTAPMAGAFVDDVHGGRLAFCRPPRLPPRRSHRQRCPRLHDRARRGRASASCGPRAPARRGIRFPRNFVLLSWVQYTRRAVPLSSRTILHPRFRQNFELLASKGSLTAFLGRHWRNSPHQLFA